MKEKTAYRKKLTIILFVSIFIPIFVLIFMYANIKVRDIYRNIDEKIYVQADMVEKNIKAFSGTVLQRSRFITYYSKINECLMKNEKEKVTSATIAKNIEISSVMNAMFSDNNLSRFCVYTTNPNATEIGVVKKIDNDEFFNSLTEEGQWKIEKDDMQTVLCYYKKYMLINGYINVIRISTPIRQIINGFSEIPFEDVYFRLYINGEGKMNFAYKSGKYSEIEVTNPEKMHKVSCEIPSINGQIEIFINNKIVISEIIKFWCIAIFFIIVLITMVAVMAKLISKYMTTELTELVAGINMGNISSIDKIYAKNKEFEIIRKYLVDLSSKLKSESEERLSFEIEMLSQRITPHFIYNNLSAVKSTCDNPVTRQAVDRFVKYCRRIFSNKSKFISVYEEFENSSEYLKVVQFCYDCDFEIKMDCSNGCRGCMVPANILQPIVENAFIHGINAMPEDFRGEIMMSTYKEGDLLCILVTDNAGQFQSGKYKMNNESKNHALDIIVKQINLYYGDDPQCGIYISGSNEKTDVVIKLRCEM